MLTNYTELVAGTNYFEFAGYPKYKNDDRGMTGSRMFRVHGSVVQHFIAAMRGCPFLEQGPESLPGFPMCLCQTADAEPMKNTKGLASAFTGGGTTPTNPGLMTSEWWQVSCYFEASGMLSYDFAGEALSLPNGNLGWLGNSTPVVGQSLVTVVPAGEMQMVRKGQAKLVADEIMAKVGMVNNAAFSPLQVDMDWRQRNQIVDPVPIYTSVQVTQSIIPPHCALFLGTSAEPVFCPRGFQSFNITYKFALRPEYAPFDKFFRVQKAIKGAGVSGRWEHLYVKGTARGLGGEGTTPQTTVTGQFEPYPPTDFAPIFI